MFIPSSDEQLGTVSDSPIQEVQVEDSDTTACMAIEVTTDKETVIQDSPSDEVINRFFSKKSNPDKQKLRVIFYNIYRSK